MDSDRRIPPESPALRRCATVGAYAVAGVVHLATAAMVIGGTLLIVLGLRTVIQPLLGVVLLALALSLRPRPGRLDADLPTLRHSDAPALFALLDRMADEAGVRRFDAVQLSPEFSVTVTHYGIRRKRCLVLGLPLWTAHAGQPPLAAIAHAMGRLAGHDLRDDAFVGTALNSLTAGSWTLRARSNGDITAQTSVLSLRADAVMYGARRFNARSRRGQWVLWISRAVMAAAARLLLWLTEPAARRAVFEADAAAARTASTEAAVAALRDRHLADAVARETHRLAIKARTLTGNRSVTAAQEEFWDEIARHAGTLRARWDVERTSAPENPVAVDSAAGLPSDALRIARLTRAPIHHATVTLEEPDRDRIEAELLLPKRAVAHQVIQDCVPLAR